MTTSRSLLAVAAFGVLSLSAVQGSAEGPAVSDTNLKVQGFGGVSSSSSTDTDGLGGIAGSFTVPFTYSFGLQIDAGYARIGDGNFGSTGAHLFWRDPTVGLIGVYAGYSRFDRFGGIDFGRAGVEAQYFWSQFTIDGAVGAKFGDIDQAYGRARLQFYPMDDLMLRAGWIYEGRSFANLGLEYQFSTSRTMGMSVFTEGNVSDSDNYSVLGGLKVTFGNSMSLKDRHRRQDPDSYFGFDAQAAQGAGQKGPAPEACPFTPDSDLCGFADASPKFLPKIGNAPQSLIAKARAFAGRLGQCVRNGYSAGSPGPAACGCAAAFNSCLPT